jgi:sugar lactone lactonase YvrE
MLAMLLLAVIACSSGGNSGGGASNVPQSYTIGGTVSGLTSGSEVSLLNNGADTVTVGNGAFTFPTKVSNNSTYSVTVGTQPIGEICEVSSGDGTVVASNISNVLITCSVPPALNVTTEVTTFAGSGVQGYFNDTLTDSQFNRPSGIALDAAGNIYIADTYNNVIRKITPSGDVSTLAGSGSSGNDNGVGTSASFSSPMGVAVDSSNNIYVADTGNNLIRKISPSGDVTTLAGSGFPGTADGTGTAATFYQPLGINVDSSGNLYVADSGYNLIRKISPADVVTTIASSPLFLPTGIGIDSAGNLFVASYNNAAIYKIAPNGAPVLFAGGATGNTNGLGAQASFYRPFAVAIDSSDNVYVSECFYYGGVSNSDIRVITPLGMVSNYAGSGAVGNSNGAGTVATFNNPQGIAFDAAGNLYVADTYNNLIRKISVK